MPPSVKSPVRQEPADPKMPQSPERLRSMLAESAVGVLVGEGLAAGVETVRTMISLSGEQIGAKEEQRQRAV